ncbi:MAG: universal stress protein [Burkholderiales bacterium]|nr:MAG: universal stress protein [Burkholderiales bacterium]
MFKHIMLPTDGSELSQRAVKACVQMAKEVEARITTINVQPDYVVPAMAELPVLPPYTPEEFRENARQKSVEILGFVTAEAAAAGVACAPLSVVSDTPWDSIVKACDEHGCDLIMMASHGRGGLAALILGSETQKVLTHSKVPVLVHR